MVLRRETYSGHLLLSPCLLYVLLPSRPTNCIRTVLPTDNPHVVLVTSTSLATTLSSRRRLCLISIAAHHHTYFCLLR